MLAKSPRGFPSLLDTLGWSRSEDWWNRWDCVNGLELARHQWQVPVSDDWIAFVGLPLLSRVELALNHGERALLGVSALPGCGKSTLCSWVKSASEQLGWPVEHLSIDDFYWPAEQLDHSMKGNPWAVPRAIPGSHDISGLLQSLRDWGQSGQRPDAARTVLLTLVAFRLLHTIKQVEIDIRPHVHQGPLRPVAVL